MRNRTEIEHTTRTRAVNVVFLSLLLASVALWGYLLGAVGSLLEADTPPSDGGSISVVGAPSAPLQPAATYQAIQVTDRGF